LSRQPVLDFALFQKIYKVSTLTLPKYAKTPQKTLESHKNHTNTHTKLEKDQTSVVAQSILPQTTFSKPETKPKAPRIDPRSIFNTCNTCDHEGKSFHNFPEQICALIMIKQPFFRKSKFL